MLADSLQTDLDADLAAYDIRDAAALRAYYRALGTVAMLQRRPDGPELSERVTRQLVPSFLAKPATGFDRTEVVATRPKW